MAIIVVGLTGCSRSGKSSLASALIKNPRCLFTDITGDTSGRVFDTKDTPSDVVISEGVYCMRICQDDYYFKEIDNHMKAFEATDWDTLNINICSGIRSLQALCDCSGDNGSGCQGRAALLIVEGFQILYDFRILNICSAIFYLELSKAACLARRVSNNLMINPKPKSTEYCEKYLWPHHEEYLLTCIDPFRHCKGFIHVVNMSEFGRNWSEKSGGAVRDYIGSVVKQLVSSAGSGGPAIFRNCGGWVLSPTAIDRVRGGLYGCALGDSMSVAAPKLHRSRTGDCEWTELTELALVACQALRIYDRSRDRRSSLSTTQSGTTMEPNMLDRAFGAQTALWATTGLPHLGTATVPMLSPDMRRLTAHPLFVSYATLAATLQWLSDGAKSFSSIELTKFVPVGLYNFWEQAEAVADITTIVAGTTHADPCNTGAALCLSVFVASAMSSTSVSLVSCERIRASVTEASTQLTKYLSRFPTSLRNRVSELEVLACKAPEGDVNQEWKDNFAQYTTFADAYMDTFEFDKLDTCLRDIVMLPMHPGVCKSDAYATRSSHCSQFVMICPEELQLLDVLLSPKKNLCDVIIDLNCAFWGVRQVYQMQMQEEIPGAAARDFDDWGLLFAEILTAVLKSNKSSAAVVGSLVGSLIGLSNIPQRLLDKNNLGYVMENLKTTLPTTGVVNLGTRQYLETDINLFVNQLVTNWRLEHSIQTNNVRASY